MLLLLFSMVGAILLPSYWNYKLKLRELDLAARTYTETGRVEGSSVPMRNPQATGVSPQPTGSSTATPTQSSSSGTPQSNERLSPRTEPPGAREQAVRSENEELSRLFESYARLLTILVAVLSAFGVFFGFFVRKSIREVEDDIRKDSTERLSEMKAKYDDLLKVTDTLKTQVESQSAELQSLTDKTQKLIGELNVALERSSAEAARIVGGDARAGLESSEPSSIEVEDVSKRIDQELSNE